MSFIGFRSSGKFHTESRLYYYIIFCFLPFLKRSSILYFLSFLLSLDSKHDYRTKITMLYIEVHPMLYIES